MTIEQIIEYLEFRLQQAIEIKDKMDKAWRDDVTDDTKYVQYMMWYATCLAIESIINYIK